MRPTSRVLTGMFSALKLASGPASLSAAHASLKLLEPTAEGPETPFLRLLNHRAAGSPSGGREDGLLEKAGAPRLRARGREAHGLVLQPLSANMAPSPSRAGARNPTAQSPEAAAGAGSPAGCTSGGGRGSALAGRGLSGRARGACVRHFRARRGERGRHGGWRGRGRPVRLEPGREAGRPRGRRPAPALFPALRWFCCRFCGTDGFSKRRKRLVGGPEGRRRRGPALPGFRTCGAHSPARAGRRDSGRALGVGWGPRAGRDCPRLPPQGEAYFDIQPVCV